MTETPRPRILPCGLDPQDAHNLSSPALSSTETGSRPSSVRLNRTVEGDPSVRLWVPPTLVSTACQVAGPLAGILAGWTLALGVLLLVRRASGGLQTPLPFWALLAVLAVVASLGAWVRWLNWASRHLEAWLRQPEAVTAEPAGPSSWFCWPGWSTAACSIGGILLWAALSLPGSSVAVLLLAWMVVTAEVLNTWTPGLARHLWNAAESLAGRFRDWAGAPARAGWRAPPVFAAEQWPEGVSCQLTSWQTEESVGWTGTLRVDFASGQRTASAHVGFCPPLPEIPTVQAQLLKGPQARIKVGTVVPHGLRLDIKLLGPPPQVGNHLPNQPQQTSHPVDQNDQTLVLVKFVATCPRRKLAMSSEQAAIG